MSDRAFESSDGSHLIARLGDWRDVRSQNGYAAQ